MLLTPVILTNFTFLFLRFIIFFFKTILFYCWVLSFLSFDVIKVSYFLFLFLNSYLVYYYIDLSDYSPSVSLFFVGVVNKFNFSVSFAFLRLGSFRFFFFNYFLVESDWNESFLTYLFGNYFKLLSSNIFLSLSLP